MYGRPNHKNKAAFSNFSGVHSVDAAGLDERLLRNTGDCIRLRKRVNAEANWCFTRVVR